MIIFGTKTYIIQLAMLNLLCGNCGNPASHAIRKKVTKFTLFFIPLFPVHWKYFTQCTFCGVTADITKEEAERLAAGQGAFGQPHPGASGNPFAGQQPPHGGHPH